MKLIPGVIGLLLLASAARAQTITIGQTAIVPIGDNGNGGLELVQRTSLSQSATINSLSFYVTRVAGSLQLGIYDATGPGGQPGSLLARTGAFTPVVGWNTANVLGSHVFLPIGYYWLAYLPSSNTLAFRKTNDIGQGAGPCFYIAQSPAFGFSTTYPTGPNDCSPTAWSLYATLTPQSGPPTLSLIITPTNPTIPDYAAPGTVVATVQAQWSDNSPFTGTYGFMAPYGDDGATFTLSSTTGASVNLIINPSGPGVTADGGTIQNVTVGAIQ